MKTRIPDKTLSAGFTLVEILLALGIAALLLTSLVTILSRSLDISKQANAGMYARSSAQVALDLIVSDLDSLAIGRNAGEIVRVESNKSVPYPDHILYLVAASTTDSGITNGSGGAGVPLAIEYMVKESTNFASSREMIYGLYRNIQDGTNSIGLSMGGTNLHESFSTNSSNFLVPNAVALQVRFYTNNGGDAWTDSGEPVHSLHATNFPPGVVMEVSLTVMDDGVIKRFQNAVSSAPVGSPVPAQMLKRFGRTMVRRVALPSPP